MGAEGVAAAVAFATLLLTMVVGLAYISYRTGAIVSAIDAFKGELLKCQGSSRLVHEVIDRRLDRHETTLTRHGERIVAIESTKGGSSP